MPYVWETLLPRRHYYTSQVHNAGSCCDQRSVRWARTKWTNRDDRSWFLVDLCASNPELTPSDNARPSAGYQEKYRSNASSASIATITAFFSQHFGIFAIEITWTPLSRNHQNGCNYQKCSISRPKWDILGHFSFTLRVVLPYCLIDINKWNWIFNYFE